LTWLMACLLVAPFVKRRVDMSFERDSGRGRHP
jgi:hypothetical protein